MEHQPNLQSEQKEGSKQQIKIRVLLFARAREIAGLSEIILEMEDNCSNTTSDCVQKLMGKFPDLQQIHGCMIIALNEEYVDGSVIVKDGDEMAIIPPISGG